MSELQQQLNARFGFESFREGQEEVMSRLLDGKSVLAIFPTGAGKSLCYQLPALLLDGLTVVISPLIALMKDQLDFLVGKGVPAARLDSTLTREDNFQLFDNLYAGKLKLLYISPERLGNERFMGAIARQRISLLAIDEAHCISEWGHNFRPDYLKIAGLAKELNVERTLCLTATATRAVADDVRAAFDIARDDEVHTGFYRPNLELNVVPASGRGREKLLLEKIQERPPGSTIVYVTLQRTAESVAAYLTANGISATAYHAGLKPELRTQVQDNFMISPGSVVVATIAFGMGIDKSDIRYVYHYNLPKGLESYSQEIGRAGRDGQPSVCEMLVVADDATTLENFSYGDTPEAATVGDFTRFVLDAGEIFDVSEYELSHRFDIRPLVVKTLLTYLELEGCLVSTRPFYSEYKIEPKRPLTEIIAGFNEERAAFLRAVFAEAKEGRTWLTIETTEVSEKIGQPRDRIVKALGYLEEQDQVALKVSGVRQGYRRLRVPADMDTFIHSLNHRFQVREANDIERIQRVLRYAQYDGCLNQYLLSYFGEDRGACGHCCRCLGRKPVPLSAEDPRPLAAQDEQKIRALISEGHESIRAPRQLARFLCGLSSPATTRARLRQETAMFGVFDAVPFRHVLKCVEGIVGA